MSPAPLRPVASENELLFRNNGRETEMQKTQRRGLCAGITQVKLEWDLRAVAC